MTMPHRAAMRKPQSHPALIWQVRFLLSPKAAAVRGLKLAEGQGGGAVRFQQIHTHPPRVNDQPSFPFAEVDISVLSLQHGSYLRPISALSPPYLRG